MDFVLAGDVSPLIRAGRWRVDAGGSIVGQTGGGADFRGTWSRHRRFPAMLATARDGGFPLHGLRRSRRPMA